MYETPKIRTVNRKRQEAAIGSAITRLVLPRSALSSRHTVTRKRSHLCVVFVGSAAMLGHARRSKASLRASVVLLDILLLSDFVALSSSGCLSSPTCSINASELQGLCYFKPYNRIWLPSQRPAVARVELPSVGLYSLAKVLKDESDCCFDLSVQVLFCEPMRGGTRVRLAHP